MNLHVRLDAGCDFADLFEVKDALQKKGTYSTRTYGGKLVLAYDRGPFSRATQISASAPARVDSEGLSFRVRIEPHGQWSTDIDVVTAQLGAGQAPKEGMDPPARAAPNCSRTSSAGSATRPGSSATGRS